MVWLVGGYSSLEAYRLERYQMTSAISGHQDLSAFHDGNGNVSHSTRLLNTSDDF